MSVTVTVVLHSCSDCRHLTHSGAFTKGGTKSICGHPDACEIRGEGKKDKYDWKHRAIRNKIRKGGPYKNKPMIPQWCPLKDGYAY